MAQTRAHRRCGSPFGPRPRAGATPHPQCSQRSPIPLRGASHGRGPRSSRSQSPTGSPPGTDYFIVVSTTASGVDFAWGHTESSADDAGAEAGWSLSGRSVYDDFGTWTANTYAYRVAIGGRPRHENTAATGTPGITGTTMPRETLTAGAGTVTDANGLPSFPGDFTFQWVRFDPSTRTGTDIEGATAQTYTLTQDDKGKKVQVRVAFTDNEGYEETRTSATYPKRGTIGADSVPPRPLSAKVLASGTQIALAFDEALASDTDVLPPAEAFTVTVRAESWRQPQGKSKTRSTLRAPVETLAVSAVSATGPATLTVELADSAQLYRGEIVSIRYTDPTASDDAKAIQDVEGHDTGSFRHDSIENESTQRVKPGMPRGLTAVAQGETRIDVSWLPPVRTGGRPVTGYKIEVYDEERSRWTTLVRSHARTSYAETGLAGGQLPALPRQHHHRTGHERRHGVRERDDRRNARTLPEHRSVVRGAPGQGHRGQRPGVQQL